MHAIQMVQRKQMLVWTRRVIKGFSEEMKPELDLELCAVEAGGLE